MPGHGVSLRLTSGERWHFGIANLDPARFAQTLAAAGGKSRAAPSMRAMTMRGFHTCTFDRYWTKPVIENGPITSVRPSEFIAGADLLAVSRY